MAKYIDGFVLMVPKKNLAAYKKMAADGGKIWKKFGAIDYKECVIDDEKPAGVVVPFRKMIGPSRRKPSSSPTSPIDQKKNATGSMPR